MVPYIDVREDGERVGGGRVVGYLLPADRCVIKGGMGRFDPRSHVSASRGREGVGAKRFRRRK